MPMHDYIKYRTILNRDMLYRHLTFSQIKNIIQGLLSISHVEINLS